MPKSNAACAACGLLSPLGDDTFTQTYGQTEIFLFDLLAGVLLRTSSSVAASTIYALF